MSIWGKEPWSRRGMMAALAAGGGWLLAGSKIPSLQAGEARPRAAQKKDKKKVLLCIGEFSEGLETYYMVYRLIEEGIQPVVVGPKAHRLQLVVHDFDPQYSNYVESKGYGIEVDMDYKKVKPTDYAGLLIPGGRGPEQIRQIKEALDLVGYFMDKNLPLGAMCHGPQVVWAARSVKGRTMTCYVALRPDLELAGARFVDEPVVVEGNLVTSRGWPDLPYFMPAFLKLLAGQPAQQKEV